MRRSGIRPARLLIVSALTTLILTACGSASPDPAASGPETELVGRGIVMQRSPDAHVELCMGAVAQSYPPQCSGPGLSGAFSWDDVEFEDQGGVRWTNDSYYGIGHYAQAPNTFTLTRPLSAQPPTGLTAPADEPLDFPQLCDDPFRGGDEGYSDPDLTLQNTFQERLDTLPGYVESWVSDGERMFNVIVTGDAQEAHASLREVWPGGLCVEQRDAPTAAEIESATQALSEHAEELRLQSWGGQGTLSIDLLLADDEHIARIHEIVQPWLTPDQVTITGSFQPLP